MQLRKLETEALSTLTLSLHQSEYPLLLTLEAKAKVTPKVARTQEEAKEKGKKLELAAPV